MQKKKFSVYGRVQGVGFRYFTWTEANRIGVKGEVCNMPDGSVQVIAIGEPEQLEKLRESLHKGPLTADVERVLEQDYTAGEQFRGFKLRY